MTSLFSTFKRWNSIYVNAICAGLVLSLMAISAADAHHSWSANYDSTKSVAVTGIISRLVFRNPHSSITLNVRNDEGRIEQWTIEWGSPQGLRERGMDPGTLSAGDALRVRGDPHRNPTTRSIHMESLVRLSDGLRISGQGRIE